jgi:hypothetical protein
MNRETGSAGVEDTARARYYLDQAERLREMATTATTASARGDFELLGLQYKDLAAQVEALERYRKHHR